ncbi:MAG: HAMP domain-containing histidine kinase [Clostridia bacterium]|nr:HAMP domain-containing histidine kinase [Clostridia bacterium]
MKNKENRPRKGSERPVIPPTEVRGDNLHWYFIACMFVILALSVGAAALITMLIEWLTSTDFTLPSVVWMLLLSIVIGLVMSPLLGQVVIRPIRRLSSAMQRVAAGDFSVRLDRAGYLGEMRQSYDAFNTMAQALSTIETLQTDFVSNVSHEFKTPINAIEGYAMLLQDTGADPALQKEYIDKILFSTRRLGDLVNSILLLSKVDNQSIPAERVTYRLDEQLRQALLMLERKWTEKDIELDVDLEPLSYTGSETLMLHVWTNLLDNAIKFDPPGGLLRLRLRREGSQIAVSVSDSGSGMTEAEMARIFDRFYQADGSHQGEGNGLGLALAQRIVRGEGGDIAVESEVGKGSCFTVTLPG